MKIPKRLGHIWIGPLDAPKEWMLTWRDLHPSWEYTLYDNKFLQNGNFETKAQIDEYMRRGSYAGVADLLRYEILYKTGGYISEADSICRNPIDELFDDDRSIYTIYENEFIRGQLVSPILASVAGHPFLRKIINTLKDIEPERLDIPWRQTGNLFLAEMIELHQPEIVVWPSHYLIPQHFTGRKYSGSGKIYADQLFGSTNKSYTTSLATQFSELRKKLYAKRAKRRLKLLKQSN